MSKTVIICSVVALGYFGLEAFNDHLNRSVKRESTNKLIELHTASMCGDTDSLTFYDSLRSSKAGWALRQRGEQLVTIRALSMCKEQS